MHSLGMEVVAAIDNNYYFMTHPLVGLIRGEHNS